MKLALGLVILVSGCVLDMGDTGDDETLGTTSDDSLRESAHRIATISYAPNSFVIGNAFPGWTDVVQGPPQYSAGPGNPNGASYRWGFIYGENFDRCAWVDDTAISPTTSVHGSNLCGTPQQIDTPHFLA